MCDGQDFVTVGRLRDMQMSVYLLQMLLTITILLSWLNPMATHSLFALSSKLTSSLSLQGLNVTR